MWLAQLLDRSTSAAPERVAVVDGRRTLTYRDLSDRASRLASLLTYRGVAQGQRVAMMSRNRVEMVEAYVGIARAGAIAVPLNHGLVEREVRHAFELTEPVALLGEGELFPVGVADWGLKAVLDWDAADYGALIDMHPAASPPQGSLDDPAIIIFTSATTGLPKGVVLTHRALLHASLSWLATAGPADGVVYLNAPPLFHSTVTIGFAYLFGAGQIVLMHRFTPQECLDVMKRESVTHAYLVPSMISFLLRVRPIERFDVPCLREVFHGAAPMPVETRLRAARALSCVLRDCYGQAEAGGPVTLGDPLGDPAAPEVPLKRWQSAGRPLLGFEVDIRGEHGQTAPPQAIGEICVRSGASMESYWNNASATAEAFDGGWLKTGDLGSLDHQGYVYVIDRRVDLVIRGGQNVYPAEIEHVLAAHPGISESAVVGVPDPDLGEVPVAFVVPRPGSEIDPDEVLKFTVGQLASYKRPKAVVIVSELPRNPAGKILKKQLRHTATSRGSWG